MHQHFLAVARGLGFDAKLEKVLDGGRRLRVRVTPTTDGDALELLKLEVMASVTDAPALRIRALTLSAAFWAVVGATSRVASTDAALDEVALVESETREVVRTRAAIKAGLGAVARELLAEHPGAIVEATGRMVAIEVPVPAEAPGLGRTVALERVIAFATRAADAIEATRIRPVEKEALVRCGFCHADILPVDEKVVRCDRCAATVHAGCWQDHEGCPAMGCAGAAR